MMENNNDQARIEQILSKYMSAKEVKNLLETSSVRDLDEAKIDFLVLQVRDDNVENVSSYLEKTVEIVIENGFMVVDILSSLVLATFGFPPYIEKNAKVDSDRCEHLAMEILQKLENNVKVIYGSKFGLYGNLGTSKRMSYGAVLPDFAKDIKTLGNLDFGVAHKL